MDYLTSARFQNDSYSQNVLRDDIDVPSKTKKPLPKIPEHLEHMNNWICILTNENALSYNETKN